MDILNEKFKIISSGFDDSIDITQKIKTIVSNSGAKDGLVTISSSYTTVSFLRVENTKGPISDIKNILSSIIPVHKIYEHDNNWHEGNAFSHLKAMFLGNSITFGIIDKNIDLKPECAIVLIDFNNKSGQIPVNATIIFDKKDN